MTLEQQNLQEKKSVDPFELQQFRKMSQDWWNPNGSSRPLHLMNPIRLDFIRKECITHLGLDSKSFFCFQKLTILDVGCGGGILSEPLARLGADVTGIDAEESLIKIAQEHAENQKLNIHYFAHSIEDFSQEASPFDVIVASEILEHVADLNHVMKLLAKLLKPQGLFIFSTLNRTIMSFMKAIIAAEYILKLIPKETHHWSKFIKPSELAKIGKQNDLELLNLQGMTYKPISQKWVYCNDLSLNYLGSFRKIK